mmetsp:Transcript_50600/g.141704  ORF Transcript_50600/g.141704 Transcript_50600/m.141704 type:complete len:269 (-) Transcript_50600:8-814(-)
MQVDAQVGVRGVMLEHHLSTVAQALRLRANVEDGSPLGGMERAQRLSEPGHLPLLSGSTLHQDGSFGEQGVKHLQLASFVLQHLCVLERGELKVGCLPQRLLRAVVLRHLDSRVPEVREFPPQPGQGEGGHVAVLKGHAHMVLAVDPGSGQQDVVREGVRADQRLPRFRMDGAVGLAPLSQPHRMNLRLAAVLPMNAETLGCNKDVGITAGHVGITAGPAHTPRQPQGWQCRPATQGREHDAVAVASAVRSGQAVDFFSERPVKPQHA